MRNPQISTEPIVNLLTDADDRPRRYLIPSYQRGYRWKELQVNNLLDDIWEFARSSGQTLEKRFYCLQPIVLKVREDGRLEVVDGQQRLTTIYLILTYFRNSYQDFDEPRFEIEYETRGETNEPFLKNIDFERCEENIDFFHMCGAYRTIKQWFEKLRWTKRTTFMKHLLNDDESGHNVKIIWYQLPEQDSPIEAFTRLNVGKIPLTSNELIRGLFLRNDDKNRNHNSFQLKVAYEWDQLEKTLQSNSFWYFLSNNTAPSQNRIGFLFELVADSFGLLNQTADDSYEVFYAFNKLITENENDRAQVWLQTKQVFMELEEWYEDRTLYHIVGFLIQSGIRISDIQKMSNDCTKSEFESKLRQEIYRKVIGREQLSELPVDELNIRVGERLDELDYDRNKNLIRLILILFNIAALLENETSNSRFEFDSFKKTEGWDIEHIRSVTDERPNRPNLRREWLENCKNFFQEQKSNDELKMRIESYIDSVHHQNDDEFDSLFDEILKQFGEFEWDENIHRISNLVLLDSSTNRSYKNAVFPIKRHRVLSLDHKGTYVPLCTRNVFLKSYSSNVDHLLCWTKEDQDNYKKAILATLTRFFCVDCGD